MPGSPVWSARAAPGLKLRFPVEEDCSSVLWCVKLVATVPAVTTILPPTESSFSRDRFLDPAVWQEFHRRLLPLQSLRSPDPPRTRSRNTTAEPLRDQKYQISEEKMRKVLVERMSRRDKSPGDTQGRTPWIQTSVFLSDNASKIRPHERFFGDVQVKDLI